MHVLRSQPVVRANSFLCTGIRSNPRVGDTTVDLTHSLQTAFSRISSIVALYYTHKKSMLCYALMTMIICTLKSQPFNMLLIHEFCINAMLFTIQALYLHDHRCRSIFTLHYSLVFGVVRVINHKSCSAWTAREANCFSAL